MKCLAQEACIENDCVEGNTGRLCAECIEGWGKEGRESVCLKCDIKGAFLKMAGMSFILIIYILLIFATTEEKKQRWKNNNDEIRIKGFLKLITAHLQQMIVLMDKNSLLGFQLDTTIDWIEIFSFTNDNVLSNDCVVKTIFPSNYDRLVLKNLIISIFPIFFAIFCFIFWSIYQTLRKNFIHDKIRKKLLCFLEITIKRLSILLVISLFLFYTIIIKTNFLIFNCVILDEDVSDSFFIDDLNLPCWSSKHFELVFIFGISSILIWGVLFPFFIYVILKQNLKKSKTDINKLEAEKIEENSIVSTAIFEFFYKDYHENRFYWEVIIFLRKFLIYLFCSFNGTLYSEIKTLALLIILFLFFSLTMSYKPYKKITLNKLELFSLSILIYTVALFSVTKDNLFYELKLILFIIFLILNAVFYFLLLFNNFKILILKIRTKKMKIHQKKKMGEKIKMDFKKPNVISYL